MGKDTTSNNSSKNRYNLRKRKQELEKEKKKNESSDSESDSNYSDSDSEQETMNHDEYQKFLSKIFPSKHMSSKISELDEFDKSQNLKNSKKEKFLKALDNEKSKKSNRDKTPSKKGKSKKSKSNSDEKKKKNEKKQKTSKQVDKKSKDDKKSKNGKKNKENKKVNKKKKKLVSESSDDSDESEEFLLDDYDSDELDSEELAALGDMGKNSKFNIIFTIGDPGLMVKGEGLDEFGEYEEDSDYEEDSEEEDSDEDSDYNEDSEEEDSDEGEGEGESDSESQNEKLVNCKRSFKSSKMKNEKIVISDESEDRESIETGNDGDDENEEDNKNEDNNVITRSKSSGKKSEKMTEEEALTKFKQLADTLYSKDKKSKVAKDAKQLVKKQEKEMKRSKDKRERKQKNKNLQKFRQAVREKNVMNDFKYFRDLDLNKQKQILAQLEEVNKISDITKPYRMILLEADIDPKFKAVALKKVNMLRYMEPGNGEFYKIKNWVDTFMKIPFGKYKTLDVKVEDGIESSHAFMENAKQILDKAVYGLNDAKLQIMQMAGQWITNPKAVGNAIAIKGPMGTGKTTLVREGISKILNRPFEFIALGGATDSSFLEGHSYTYEGSTWGQIVEILIKSQCMNPVIYFDELDKVSDTPKGEEIIGILTHLTDTSQNQEFHDKYFADLNFDLSKVLFIFSYNDEKRVNPILRDRMYRIHTKGYDKKQKTEIINNYLIPSIRENVKFDEGQIEIPEETLHYIIENHTDKEDGVRNLKRCIEIIYTKLNLFRLMKPDTNLFDQDLSLKVEFPFTVTTDVVDKLIKREKEDKSMLSLYL